MLISRVHCLAFPDGLTHTIFPYVSWEFLHCQLVPPEHSVTIPGPAESCFPVHQAQWLATLAAVPSVWSAFLQPDLNTVDEDQQFISETNSHFDVHNALPRTHFASEHALFAPPMSGYRYILRLPMAPLTSQPDIELMSLPTAPPPLCPMLFLPFAICPSTWYHPQPFANSSLLSASIARAKSRLPRPALTSSMPPSHTSHIPPRTVIA